MRLIYLLILLTIPVDSSTLCELLKAPPGRQTNARILETVNTTRQGECLFDLTPHYYWAQNMSHIFVKIEFHNSIDTPACDLVLQESKAVQYYGFSIRLLCLHSATLLRYSLSVNVYLALNKVQHSWRADGQNGLILECMKSPNPSYWPQLHANSSNPTHPARVWWKMLEKHMADIQPYMTELMVDESETLWRTAKGGKNRTEGIYFYCNRKSYLHLGSW